MSKSDDIQKLEEEYNNIERITDRRGRTFGVKRLRPSQINRIREMAPKLDGEITVEMADGQVVKWPKIQELFLAASICEINGIRIPFPNNRAELDSMLDRMDDGMPRVAEALAKLIPVVPPPDEGDTPAEALVQQIKNG